MMRTKSAVIWVCNGACMLHGVCCTLTDFGCRTGTNVRRSDGLTCSGGDSSESGIWSSMRRRTNYRTPKQTQTTLPQHGRQAAQGWTFRYGWRWHWRDCETLLQHIAVIGTTADHFNMRVRPYNMHDTTSDKRYTACASARVYAGVDDSRPFHSEGPEGAPKSISTCNEAVALVVSSLLHLAASTGG